MIHQYKDYDRDAPVVLVDIGNTTTTIATWCKGEVKTPVPVAGSDSSAFEEAFGAHVDALPKRRPAAVIVASVVPDRLARIRDYVEEKLERNVLVVGDSIPLPIEVGVKDSKSLGVDRACAAAAAYDELQSACTVIDFGSAVTVDLVDTDGVLVGGAILPGLKMQFQALHEHTASLPEVEPGMVDSPYGRDTLEAMQIGVCRGLIGAVRGLVESYATSLDRWPQVLATGGDLEFIAPHCDFLDTLVDHLTVRGVGLAYVQYLEAEGA